VARHRAGRPGQEGKAAVPAGPGGVRGPRRRTRRGARIPGTPAAAHATSRLVNSSGIRSWYGSPRRPRSFSIRSISGWCSSPQHPQVRGDGGVVQPCCDREAAGAERDVPGPGLHRWPGQWPTPPNVSRSGPVGVPVVFEQTQRGPPGVDPLEFPRRAAGPLWILSAAPTQGWESPSDTPIITRLSGCRTRRKRPDPFRC